MEIIREYDWNGKHYVVVEKDGQRVELKCSHDDAQAVADRLITTTPGPSPAPEVRSVKDLTDAELLDEVKSRSLSVVARGKAI